MTGRTHDLIAFTGLLTATIIYPPAHLTLGTAVAAFLANQVGGITPDIDQPTAPFWRNLPIGGLIGKIISKMLGGHRFITHSVLGLILFGFLAKLLLGFIHPIFPRINMELVWWAYMIGMVSHLIIDTFSKEGVPWLLPIPIKFGIPPIRAWRITTDKFTENWVLFPGLIFVNLVLIATNYEVLVGLLHKV
ncbi:metal-dependent hydrolase [bacterium]|nr:metal-dependent hydrolase [bacterium]